MSLTGDQKIMLAVGGVTVVAVTSILLWSGSAAATPGQPQAPQAGPVWTEITGQGVTVPAGTTVALSFENPSPEAVTELEAMGHAAANVATEFGLYPVGTPAPFGFPDDGGDLKSFRMMVKTTMPGANAQAPGLRVWTHP